jgi:hypothetical protein
MFGEGLDKSGGVQITMVIKFTRHIWSMSGKSLWKPALEPDMSDFWDLTRVKVERPDMFGLGVEHVQKPSLEPR